MRIKNVACITGDTDFEKRECFEQKMRIKNVACIMGDKDFERRECFEQKMRIKNADLRSWRSDSMLTMAIAHFPFSIVRVHRLHYHNLPIPWSYDIIFVHI